MDNEMEVIYDSPTPNGCYSLRKTLPDGTYHRMAVCPGEFGAVEAFAPELLPVFAEIWTPEVISAYNDSLPTEETAP